MNRAPTLAAALAATLTLACERPPELDRPLDPRAPHAFDHHVAWLLDGPPALFTLAPATLATDRHELPAAPITAVPDPERDGLLILDARPAARYVPLHETDPPAALDIPLTAPYGDAVFAPGGRHVILYAGDTATGAPIQNPNQIAIIDLDTRQATERTLRSFGERPAAIHITPFTEIAGAERQLAFILSDRYLAVIDLTAPTAREVIVHLTLQGDPRVIQPRDVQLAPTADGPTAFVRATGADDIFALTFPTDTPPGTVPRPVLNQLPAGQRPADLAVRTLAAGTRLFTAEPTLPGVSVIDPVTADRVAIPTDTVVSRIIPFEAPRPDGDDGHFALLWHPGATGVVFADLDHLQQQRGRALTPLVLGGGVQTLSPIPDRRAAVATVADTQVVIIDFDARTATPLTVPGGVDQLIVDPAGDRIYLAADHDLIAIDTDTLTTRSARAPFTGGTLLHTPGADRLVYAWPDPLGDVLVLDETPDPDRVIHRAPLFIEGAFDR